MCLFCDILEGKVPSKKVYEDSYVYAFRDLYPQAKKHILIIPKKHIESLATISEEDISKYVPKLFLAAKDIAKEEKILESGFRTVFNCNKHGAQTVYHMHLHLVGGEQLGSNMSGLRA